MKQLDKKAGKPDLVKHNLNSDRAVLVLKLLVTVTVAGFSSVNSDNDRAVFTIIVK